MKKLIAFSLFAFLLLLFSACNGGNRENKGEGTSVDHSNNSASTATDTIRGNTAGNISMFGLFAQEKDWIYYLKYEDGHWNKLYRTRLDSIGNSRDLLISANIEDMSYINIFESWIYFIDEHSDFGDGGSICRVPIEGGKKEILFNAPCRYLSIVDNWIYFENVDDDQHLYRMHLDGSARQAIDIFLYDNDDVEDSIYEYRSMLNVAEDWIYCYVRVQTPDSSDTGIVRSRIDGSESELVLLTKNESVKNLIFCGEWLYYIQNGDIYRIKPSGKDEEKLSSDGNIESFNTDGNDIFYVNRNFHLFQLLANGTSREIFGESVFCVFISNDWLYYYSIGDGMNVNLCRIRTNGTEVQIID